ncbi:uncharacterized protein L201_002921 [Kwoniella dendrophila CBS 6074]|uniref:GDP/GTP exchange factor Sec2 N-terminal domain-containing protein n=1 Tax=Kwoniella dendrophila CBS 6074 TaxID=1295534 RepID=A0AAX4JU44_9TREE
MASPKPEDHPLPNSPDPNVSPVNSIALSLHPENPQEEPKTTSTNTQAPNDIEASKETEELIQTLKNSLETAQHTISLQTTKLSTLSDLETELVQLKDQFQFLSAAKEAVEISLKEEIKRREVAEENVELLRGQVEQARRGVMVLQKQDAERKRMSTISSYSGLNNTGILGLGINNNSNNGEEEVLNSDNLASTSALTNTRESKLVKRQSIMRSHRRQSSQSEPPDIYDRDRSNLVSSPNLIQNQRDSTSTTSLRPSGVVGGGQGLRELRLGHTPPSATIPTATLPSPIAPTHQSGYFEEQQQLSANIEQPSSTLSRTSELPSKKEIEAVEEANRLRDELTNFQNKALILQNQLDEAQEARIASENCLKVLREFIATGSSDGQNNLNAKEGEGDEENMTGELSESTADLLKGLKLPPLPTDRDADEEERIKEKEREKNKTHTSTNSGWGFKLWNAKTATAGPNSTSPSVLQGTRSPQKALSPIKNRSRAGSNVTLSPLPTPLNEDLPTPTSGTGSGLTASISSQTPLSSFVSSWTKGVTSPPITSNTGNATSPQPERPTNTRKISVTNFFSRGNSSKKELPTEFVREDLEEKELPTPPKSELQVESESDSNKDNTLEPSPEIATKQLVFTHDDDDDHKRLSRGTTGTTVTELEDELGTPQESLKETHSIEEEKDIKAGNEGIGKKKMEEIAL